MATRQGAAGVKIRLSDRSEVQIVDEPIVTAGVVGFSSKGPLNKIINLSSTESMDVVLGTGYNNPKFNQGMYAARGILNARGLVEFVRPYGEAIVEDDDNKQELKSDAFMVNYDFDSGATDSIQISHYAATRYVDDGMANDFPGSSRQIYRISDAIVNNSNINFEVDCEATGDSVPLFAIINEDPTAANRLNSPLTDKQSILASGRDYLAVKTPAKGTTAKYNTTLEIDDIPVHDSVISVIRENGSVGDLLLVDPTDVTPLVNDGYVVNIAKQSFLEGAVTVGATTTIELNSITGYSVGDKVRFTSNVITGGVPDEVEDGTTYTISNITGNVITLDGIDTSGGTPLDSSIVNLTLSLKNIMEGFAAIGFGISRKLANDLVTLEIDVVRGLYTPSTGFTSFYTLPSGFVSTTTIVPDSETKPILIESSIGRQFVSLGLAVEEYIDINFDGINDKVYVLTADGESIAPLYLEVDYFFAGVLYTFAGTIVPKVLNDQNIYILDQAKLVENGFVFVLNTNDSLADAASSTEFDFTTTVVDSSLNSYAIGASYNATDPAIVDGEIWVYAPKNNNTSSTLASAWELFLKKDQTNTDMFISAGTSIRNLFTKNEQIDYEVMTKIITICELRKDCFAIFDGLDYSRVDQALQRMQGVTAFGNDLGRWGSIFDGRSIMFDTVYTKLSVEVVKSIEVAQLIAFNRASGVYWLPPAGFQTGRIPASMANRQKYIRSYGYGADDLNSDIAKLYDANINPTRVTQGGSFIFGAKTMLRRNTALNRLNVIMLIAGIHRRFANYLDNKTFQLNTSQLRSNIQSELQARMDAIATANPPGVTLGRVICDETNNTPDVIDRNELIVDVIIQPTRTAEFITLRTTVQRTGADINTNVSIIGG